MQCKNVGFVRCPAIILKSSPAGGASRERGGGAPSRFAPAAAAGNGRNGAIAEEVDEIEEV